MINKGFIQFSMFNRFSLVNNNIILSNRFNKSNIYQTSFLFSHPIYSIVTTSHFNYRSFYQFTTLKKPSVSPKKNAYKLKKTQLITDQNGQKYFLLYDAHKQQKSFQIVSGLFILLFGLSLVKLYYTQSQYRRDEYVVLFVIAASFFVYQRRILKTLKKVTLSPKGDKLFLTTFNLIAKGQTTIDAPIDIMTGFSRATRLGGYILKGGGKQIGFKQMRFWFSKQYIADQPTFEYVGQGKYPKIVDQYQNL